MEDIIDLFKKTDTPLIKNWWAEDRANSNVFYNEVANVWNFKYKSDI